MTPKLSSDELSRQLIRTSLDESMVVEASAGTGKTTELVNRIVAVLRSGRTTVDRIAAVTFTHKAAGELKIRLRQELDEARHQATGRELDNLEDALKRLEDAAIGTIHSFCAQILRERPVEADVDPAFQDLPEQEQRRLYARAFHAWFEHALAESRPGLRRALSRVSWTSDNNPAAELQRAGLKLIEWRDFRAPWSRPPFHRDEEVETLAAGIRYVAELSGRCIKPYDDLFKATRPFRELSNWMDRAGSGAKPDYDILEGLLLKLLRDVKRFDRKGRGAYAEGVAREDVIKARDELIAKLERFKRDAEADLAALIQSEMQDLIDRYDDLKRRAGKLDFVDLLIKVRELVRNNLEVRAFLQNRFTHLFVDEFQDTDPLQSEVLLLLASADPTVSDARLAVPKPGKLFIVGDPKQSIYKFRRADVAVYQEVRDRLLGAGVRMVKLSRSYRSLKSIQACVNAAFAPVMEENLDRAQAGYVPLEGDREPIGDQPGVVVIPAPRPWGSRNVTKTAINGCLPEAIVAWIDWLLRDSAWRVRDPDCPDRLIPIEARHIAVLFRRFINYGDDLTRPYIRGLEARDIPHLLVGSKSFHEREEVETLRSACTAIEWPDDELSVYATLRGSLFAVPDALLLRYRVEAGRLHPLRPDAPVSKDFAPVTEVLDLLADLHRRRNRRPIAETVNVLLEATRAHIGFALRPGGHQALSNVLRISELARGFEASGGISFRGFVDELDARAEGGDSSEAPMMEESADGVRLLTVHAAKGLEFPVVVLADMTANIAAREPDRYIDPARNLHATRLLWCTPHDLLDHEAEEKCREESEGVRVAYVAATRARDLLVLPGVGDQEMNDGWLSPFNAAIYPPPPEYRNSRPAPGCPDFGIATVLERPAYGGPEVSVRPGLLQPRAGEHQVVWWDPSALHLNVEAKLGIRDPEILAGASNASTKPYEDWKAARASAVARGAVPQCEIVNPSEAADAPGAIDLTVIAAAPLGDRPGGRRFGTLVHTILRDVGFDAGAIESLAKSHGRALGAEPAEIEAAIDAVRTALDHPLIARARNAKRNHRELPITLKLDNNRIMDGSIDLAFLEGETWHIVDFKTDAHVAGKRAQYERQLKWYAAALTRLTNLPSRCYLLCL
jgi:ATP-dependent helicase/nuclease subunit A